MRNYRNSWATAPCLAAAFLLTASPAFSYAENPKFDKAVVERGRGEFVSSCGFCHGNDATGNRAPDLVRSPLVTVEETTAKKIDAAMKHAGLIN